jgi:hypothetical protein
MLAKSRQKFLFILLATFMLAGGCKPTTSDSSIKSLDNFAGISQRVNSCKADPSKQYDPADYPMLNHVRFLGPESENNEFVFKQNISHALANIPSNIQKIFVKAGGKVVVADNSKKMCESLTKNAKPEESDSCVVFIAATKNNGQILHLVLPPDLTSIHHNLMRLAGMFLVDVVPLADESRKQKISEFMARNTIAFIEDLYTSKAFDGKKILKDLVGDAVGESLLSSRKKDGPLSVEAIDKILGKGGKDFSKANEFSRKVFVESLDSYFCNSWEKVNEKIFEDTKNGNITQLNQLKNTRAVMLVLFPNSYKFYDENIKDLFKDVMNPVKASASLTSGGQDFSNQSFSLQGFGQRVSETWDMSTAAVGAFGKSLFWDQTTKPIANAYAGYSQRVQDNWNNGSGIIGGYTGAAAGAYQDNVVKPTQDRTQAVFDRQVASGADVNSAYRNTLAVELLRPTGATAVAESAVLAERFDGSQYKDGFERASELSFGIAGVASTAAVPLSLLPKGAVPLSPGVTPSAGQAAANAQALEAIGVDAGRASSYGAAFEAGATPKTYPAGTSLYRVGEGKGSWFTTQPYRDPINSLALPATSEAGASNLSRVVTTRPVTVIEGGVSPQPNWATPGNPKLGGGSQVYMNYAEATGGAVKPVSLETPLQQSTIPVIGGGTTSNAIPAE